MQSIDYCSLKSSQLEIRLLTLCPVRTPAPMRHVTTSSKTSTVTCILNTVSLHENPSYIALSYAWGETPPCKTIHVNGKAITVRANLEAALVHIQEDDRAVTLWVDTICIDQENKEEKSQQVQMMRDIYATAQSVLVWLGVADHDSDIAMDLLKNIGEKAIDARILDLRGNDLENLSNPEGDERLSIIKASLDAFAQAADLELFHPSLINFSEREYWTRTWIVQEVSVAQDVTLMCCSKKLSFRTFSAASNFCGYARKRQAEHMTLDQWMDPVRGPLLKATMAKAPSAAPNVVIGIRRRYQRETGDPESVFGLLKRSCFIRPAIHPLKATDSKDKIYGLLGLDSSNQPLDISPDYTKTTKEVYTAATRAFIASAEVNILAWSQQHKIVQGLPTWVPDFSSPIRPPCGENDRIGSSGAIYFASGKHPASLISHDNPNVIGLLGVLIDTVAAVGTPWLPPSNASFDYESATQLFNDIEHYCTLSQQRGSTPSREREKWSEATWRIPCADQEAKSSGRVRASSMIHSAYLELKLPDAKFKQGSVARRYYQTVLNSLYERRPVISTEGFVGLAPAHSQPGDWICIILGANFPFLLRRRSIGAYELIGEAYVHGIMDGEGMQLGRDAESIYLS